MNYEIVIDPKAIQDLQKAITYYEEKQQGLGKKFGNVIDKHFQQISKQPFYQIRYDKVRCLPVRKFPFMVHYFVDEIEKKIYVSAVFHTALNPNKWEKRNR